MKSDSQLDESIRRFQESFWDKRSADRPPVGVVNPDLFLPIRLLRAPPARAEIAPADVGPANVMTEYEYDFARRKVACDDMIPYVAAWRGIPWLEACCGCPVRYSAGSMAPAHFVGSAAELDAAPIPAGKAWPDCLRRETERLSASLPDDCWLSATILRGPSDAIAAMRGQAEFFYDLFDDIDAVDRAAGRINRLLMDLLDVHFAVCAPKRGGYAHIYGYWAPGPTVVLQEDVLGQCAPAVYRDVFQKYNAAVVERLGPNVFFHLHTTGMRHWRDALAIPGLAGLELTVEANGPAIGDLLPAMREILEKSRLILFVDHGFSQLPDILRQLPREGLYVLLRDDHVRSDEEFHALMHRLWQCD